MEPIYIWQANLLVVRLLICHISYLWLPGDACFIQRFRFWSDGSCFWLARGRGLHLNPPSRRSNCEVMVPFR